MTGVTSRNARVPMDQELLELAVQHTDLIIVSDAILGTIYQIIVVTTSTADVLMVWERLEVIVLITMITYVIHAIMAII